jgi:hypothetical protein
VKLAEDVVSDVLESWRRDGPAALARVACFDPGKYIDFIAKVLPKEVKLEVTTPTDRLSDDQLEAMIEFSERMAGLHAEQAKVIEATLSRFRLRPSRSRRWPRRRRAAPAVTPPQRPSVPIWRIRRPQHAMASRRCPLRPSSTRSTRRTCSND